VTFTGGNSLGVAATRSSCLTIGGSFGTDESETPCASKASWSRRAYMEGPQSEFSAEWHNTDISQF
jgi:hypothetical protein